MNTNWFIQFGAWRALDCRRGKVIANYKFFLHALVARHRKNTNPFCMHWKIFYWFIFNTIGYLLKLISASNHFQLFKKYLVLRPPPFITNTSCSSKYCKALVAVAFDVLVIEAYFVAFIPPSKPSGPASNIFCITSTGVHSIHLYGDQKIVIFSECDWLIRWPAFVHPALVLRSR